MKKKLIILIIFIPLIVTAQKQGNIWYFGNDAGLDFNSGLPIPLVNGQTLVSTIGYCPIEGTAVISDSLGDLLFYTNGQTIWNKNQQVMPNGDSLLGNYSSTQAALIVPLPTSSRYFYVFTTDDFCNDNLQYGFRYTIVDICLDNGLGDVMQKQKNIKLLDMVAEKLTAVRHANGTDYWIIVHKYYSDAFYSYHLSSSGITDTVISHVGSRHPLLSTSQNTGGAIGQLKASPNGQKLAIVNGNCSHNIAEYFDFDKNTGVVSNCINIQPVADTISCYYGISFSPDNSKLYITGSLNDYQIYQFNLNAGSGNPDSVIASRIPITNYNCNYWALQLAADGKIYVTRGNNSGNYNYLSVINIPNNLGLNCNYQDSVIYLGGKTYSWGLPNFIDSYDYSNTIANCSTEGINEVVNRNSAILYQNAPNPFGNGTTIKYFVPENADAQIIFYDEFGAQLKIFKITEKGNGQLNVDASNLASGMYSYSLFLNGKVIDNKKMVRNK